MSHSILLKQASEPLFSKPVVAVAVLKVCLPFRGKPMKIHAFLGYTLVATIAVHLSLNFKPLYT